MSAVSTGCICGAVLVGEYTNLATTNDVLRRFRAAHRGPGHAETSAARARRLGQQSRREGARA